MLSMISPIEMVEEAEASSPSLRLFDKDVQELGILDFGLTKNLVNEHQRSRSKRGSGLNKNPGEGLTYIGRTKIYFRKM